MFRNKSTKLPTSEEVGQLERKGAGANFTYQKFVILTHARSGSSLMVQLLKSHPEVLCFGELFVNGRIGFNEEGFDQNHPELMGLRSEAPDRFLEEYVFAGWSEDRRAVGFKLFPDQMDNPQFKGVWDWLERNEDVKIIHLNRNNQLATYASLLKARKTKQFGITDQSSRSSATVAMDPTETRIFFEQRERYRQQILSRFDDRRMDVSYEELDEDMESCMERIQVFLGLQPVSLKSKKVKQEVRPLRGVVENYEALKSTFADSPWSNYFE